MAAQIKLFPVVAKWCETRTPTAFFILSLNQHKQHVPRRLRQVLIRTFLSEVGGY
jgi:hypothetical protein